MLIKGKHVKKCVYNSVHVNMILEIMYLGQIFLSQPKRTLSVA